MQNSGSSILDAVIETLQSQNRDLRSVTLAEAKDLTLQIVMDRQRSATKLQPTCDIEAVGAKRFAFRRASVVRQC